jgi:hypothetical protein
MMGRKSAQRFYALVSVGVSVHGDFGFGSLDATRYARVIVGVEEVEIGSSKGKDTKCKWCSCRTHVLGPSLSSLPKPPPRVPPEHFSLPFATSRTSNP